MTTAAHRPSHGFLSTHRPHVGTAAITQDTAARYVFSIARLSLGWMFLWAFLDKTFGFGHSTAHKAAWIHGGSPTKGFLKFSAKGPFESFYHSIAGAAWADWLFMIGLAGLGIALILGVGMRVAAVAGTALLVMMWSVVLPPANDVFMDYHLFFALGIVGMALAGTGDTLGLGRWWSSTALVKRLPILK